MGSDRTTVMYTIGYEGRTPEDLVEVLKRNRVAVLVDIRLSPQSRMKGFSLRALFETMRKAGIRYEHMRDLGNPPEIRALFHGGKLEEGRRRYRAFLTNGHSAALDALISEAQRQPTAILCVERFPGDCHRDVVADVAGTRSDFRVEHL
jgi:uncharacterized protein (DUF488 family)